MPDSEEHIFSELEAQRRSHHSMSMRITVHPLSDPQMSLRLDLRNIAHLTLYSHLLALDPLRIFSPLH